MAFYHDSKLLEAESLNQEINNLELDALDIEAIQGVLEDDLTDRVRGIKSAEYRARVRAAINTCVDALVAIRADAEHEIEASQKSLRATGIDLNSY